MDRYRRRLPGPLACADDSEWSELGITPAVALYAGDAPLGGQRLARRFLAREQQFDEVWLRPVLAAASRAMAPFVFLSRRQSGTECPSSSTRTKTGLECPHLGRDYTRSALETRRLELGGLAPTANGTTMLGPARDARW